MKSSLSDVARLAGSTGQPRDAGLPWEFLRFFEVAQPQIRQRVADSFTVDPSHASVDAFLEVAWALIFKSFEQVLQHPEPVAAAWEIISEFLGSGQWHFDVGDPAEPDPATTVRKELAEGGGPELPLDLSGRTFEEFYRELDPYVRRRVNAGSSASQADRDDILQDVWTRVFLNWERVRTLTMPKAYVLTMAKHALMDSYRKEMRRRGQEVLVEERHLDWVPDTAAADALDSIETRSRIMELMTQVLSKRQLQILGMRADGASNAEIAAACGITRNTVRVHIMAIRDKVREALHEQSEA
ncbi:RNA polymerase sigma factor [Streptomyces nigra]